jgi:hypothetical protein
VFFLVCLYFSSSYVGFRAVYHKKSFNIEFGGLLDLVDILVADVSW